ncbi:unnamed protein product [Boreogadus saida]
MKSTHSRYGCAVRGYSSVLINASGAVADRSAAGPGYCSPGTVIVSASVQGRDPERFVSGQALSAMPVSEDLDRANRMGLETDVDEPAPNSLSLGACRPGAPRLNFVRAAQR